MMRCSSVGVAKTLKKGKAKSELSGGDTLAMPGHWTLVLDLLQR